MLFLPVVPVQGLLGQCLTLAESPRYLPVHLPPSSPSTHSLTHASPEAPLPRSDCQGQLREGKGVGTAC